LVLAKEQTSGRGRGANRWWAGPGALTFSWVIDPLMYNLPPERFASSAIAVGLAILDVIRDVLPEELRESCGLKWPNDIYVGSRKICGILCETNTGETSTGETAPRMIIGVGININNRFTEAPKEIAALATSLVDLTGRLFPLEEMLAALLEGFDQELKKLAANDSNQQERWNVASLLTNRMVTIELGPPLSQKNAAGRVVRINEHGALVLQTEVGQRTVLSGTVKSISPPL